jgi:hypothetical protein
MKSLRIVALVVPLFLSAIYPARGAESAATSPAHPDAARLAWLEGCWSGVQNSITSEEHWTSPAGDGLVGMHKDLRGGRMVSYEFFRIAASADGKLCYFASPRGAAPTPFCAIEVGEKRAVFENKEHDFPQRVLYWMDARGHLHARIEGAMNGKEESEEWEWTRCATKRK